MGEGEPFGARSGCRLRGFDDTRVIVEDVLQHDVGDLFDDVPTDHRLDIHISIGREFVNAVAWDRVANKSGS